MSIKYTSFFALLNGVVDAIVRVPYLTATTIAAVFAVLLNWWAWNRTIGTVNTAVTRLRLEHSVALFAFVEPLACIRWHDLRLGVAANWAGQHGFKNDSTHEDFLSMVASDVSLNKRHGSHHR